MAATDTNEPEKAQYITVSACSPSTFAGAQFFSHFLG